MKNMAITHHQFARCITEPVAGTYAVRLVKRGPLVPVRLEMVGGKWQATVDGNPQSFAYTPEQVEAVVMVSLLDGRLNSHEFVKLLAFADAIDEAEYQRMLDLRAWARENDPDHACLHPRQPINLTKRASLW